MKKRTKPWTVAQLAEAFDTLNFPEYQREPTVWSTNAKRRLLDSISREFDIASLYLYKNEDGTLDCVDGRQRIGAIMSFLGRNPKDEKDNGFTFQVLNEIFNESESAYSELTGMSYDQIKEGQRAGDETCAKFADSLDSYELTVVELSGAGDDKEFNLQFTRLNLGVIINSGEKLHAMVGDIRNACFGDVGQHPFLQAAHIPTRRFSREQTAAQILAQVFAFENWRETQFTERFEKTRHVDLQRLFKENERLSPVQRRWIAKVMRLMDVLQPAFEGSFALRNRAIVVSAVLLAYVEELETKEQAHGFCAFLEEFMGRLLWQVGKGLEAYRGYHYLVEFQRNITQASVERRAVQARADVLQREYHLWLQDGAMSGDSECRLEHGEDPGEAWRRVLRPGVQN